MDPDERGGAGYLRVEVITFFKMSRVALSASAKTFKQTPDSHTLWLLPSLYLMTGQKEDEYFHLLGLRFLEWDVSICWHVKRS